MLRSSDRVIVQSTIGLGHNLGLDIVAEGVEDEATCRALAEHGCDVVQGYWFTPPLPADQMVTWLEERAGQSLSALAS
jgi:EAL domain-containing protein (putative c-di-GMP-specific phosphodiesterase class I)